MRALIFFILAFALTFAHGQGDGALDPIFGNGGITTTGLGPTNDVAFGIAVQADGKAVVIGLAGVTNTPFLNDFGVVRYNTDGTLDATFGNGGIVTTNIGGDDQARAVAIQNDGKIVVAGAARFGNSWDFALVRYLPSGSLDNSFGTNGIVTWNIAGGDDLGFCMALQQDGKIILAGSAVLNGISQMAALRFNSNGTIDNTFGTTGAIMLNFGGANSLVNATVIQPDGKIILGGTSGGPNARDIALIRLNANGTLDASFNGGGVLTSLSPGNDIGRGMALQPDGRILICGNTHLGNDPAMTLLRYMPNGTLDPSFGSNGHIILNEGPNDDRAWALAIQPDGQILMAGQTSSSGNLVQHALIRIDTNGTLDASFGSGGMVLTPSAFGSSYAHALALHGCHIFTAGGISNGSNTDFLVTRHVPAPPAQPSPVTPSFVCAGSTITFSVAAMPNTTYQWVINGGAPVTGGATFNTPLSANSTIMVTPVSECGVAGQSRTTQITVTQPSNAGTNGNLTTCSNSAVQSLFAQLGGNPTTGGTWNPSAPSGNYDPATMNPGVYTYTVTGVAPCPNATATVTVVENQAPNAGGNGTLSTCSNGASVSLFAQLTGTPQESGGWSGPSATTGSYNPATMSPGVYTYTVIGIAPCSNATSTVTVSETVAPNPGTNGTLALCETSAPTDLFAVLGGNPDQGGIWDEPITTSGTFDPATMPPGIYTYLVIGNTPCPDASSTVTVSVNPLPNAGTSGSLEICSNGEPISLLAQLGGTPQTDGTWNPNAPGGMYDPASMNPGTYTYTVNGIAPCPDASSTVSVSESAAPDAGTNGSLSLCTYSAPDSLFDALNGTPQTGGTWSGPSPVVEGLYNPATMIAGPYTYTVSGSAPCTDDFAVVLVSVPALELAAITGPTGVEVVQPTTYTATPLLADADSILWTFPASWDWDASDLDLYDHTAILLPPASAGIYSICARAVGAGCVGPEICVEEVIVSVGIANFPGAASLPMFVYPNPSRGLFRVDFDAANMDAPRFEVLDLSGRLLSDMGRQQVGFDMDLSHLASGTYMLVWRSDYEVGRTPLVIQR